MDIFKRTYQQLLEDELILDGDIIEKLERADYDATGGLIWINPPGADAIAELEEAEWLDAYHGDCIRALEALTRPYLDLGPESKSIIIDGEHLVISEPIVIPRNYRVTITNCYIEYTDYFKGQSAIVVPYYSGYWGQRLGALSADKSLFYNRSKIRL